MWRISNYIAVLMGATMLMLTFALHSARVSPEPLPIISTVTSSLEVVETVQGWPAAPHNIAINRGGLAARVSWSIDPSLDSATIISADDDEGVFDFYRIETTHPTFVPIIQDAIRDQTVFQPNSKGMVYTTANSDGSLNYWVLYWPTNTRWRINDLVKPYTSIDNVPTPLFWGDGRSVFSQDGRWLYLLQRELGGPFNIMAVSLEDRTMTNLTPDQSFLEMPHLRTPFNDWLIFRLGTRYYRRHPDGTGHGLLINDDWRPTDPAQTERSWREFETLDVIIVNREETYVGVRVSTGEVLWELGHEMASNFLIRGSPLLFDEWIILMGDSNGKFNVVTGQFIPDPDPTRVYQTNRLSPDWSWLFYVVENPTTGTSDLWRYSLMTGDEYMIRADVGEVSSFNIAPDGQQLVLVKPDSSAYYLNIDTDSMDRLLPPPSVPNSGYDVDGWMHPIEFSWHPSRLRVTGFTLLTIGLLPRRLLKRFRRPVVNHLLTRN